MVVSRAWGMLWEEMGLRHEQLQCPEGTYRQESGKANETQHGNIC